MNAERESGSTGLIRSRAPVRVDLAGGWTDVAEFCSETPGAVVNVALALHAQVTLSPRNQPEETDPDENLRHRGRLKAEGVSIFSSDFYEYIEAASIRDLEYDGNVDLVKAAMRAMDAPGGFDLITSSSAPPGSGLGTSASMGVALLASLCRYEKRHMVAYELAEEASRIEREELGIRGGKQDHYASALGGMLFLEFHGPVVQASPLPLRRGTLLELESNLIVAYVGQSRLSGDVHAQVSERFSAGDAGTRQAIEDLKAISRGMKRALMAEEMAEVGRLIDANWDAQKRLHSATTTDRIEECLRKAKEEGALGGKACGAGGGGCIAVFAPPDRAHRIRKALEQLETQPLEVILDDHGVESWEVRHA